MKNKRILPDGTFAISHILLLIILSFLQVRAGGEVDASFNAFLAKVGVGTVYRSAIQSDGKIIIIGDFKMVSGVFRPNIARLNTDGTLDTTFNPPTSITGLGGFLIETVALQSTGKIVIGGPFQRFDGNLRQGIARLNPNGSLDTIFNSNPSLNTVALVYDLKVVSDDKIIFSGIRSGGINVVTRLTDDGNLNAEGSFQAFRFNMQSDGKVVFYDNSNNTLRRLNQDITLDSTFSQVTFNVAVYAIIVQPDDKTVVGGLFTTINGAPSPSLARINANGSVDAPFLANSSSAGGNIQALLNMPNGKILSGGGAGIRLINADGTRDPSFIAQNNLSIVDDLDIQTDGKIIASGNSTGSNIVQTLVIRFNSDGSPDASFQSIVGDFGTGDKVLVMPDNKILVSGDFNYSNGALRHSLVKFIADGSLDTTFDQNVFPASVAAFDILPDGKIIASGGGVVNGGAATIRLNSDGTRDFGFLPADYATDIKILPDGKILLSIAGQGLERHNSDGPIDPSFSVTTVGTINKIALQSDGKILIGGTFTSVNGIGRSRIARLNADGTLDNSFNPPGGSNGTVRDVASQPDGKVILGGSFSSVNFTPRVGLARLNGDGSLDTDFVPPTDNSVYTVRIQPDGKILIGGVFSTPRNRYARLNNNGTRDTSFKVVTNPAVNSVTDLDLQSDGKIIMTGDFLRINGTFAAGIKRLLNYSKVLFDYDGDGKTDVSVFRPTTNRWYEFLSSTSTVFETTFGLAGDVVAPADYDGDGKTDVAIFRPSAGDWWYQSSLNNTQNVVHWGQLGDIPCSSDFDGDGKSDYVVFRPSASVWYRFSNTGSVSIVPFGTSGDKPVIGDFDGDGKSDVGIFRPSTGDWWWQSSNSGVQMATHWGSSTDVPAPADYDGDGKTDFAVYRPSTGIWYVLNTSNGQAAIVNFGISEDKPVPGDYDGDGKADIAVFRPSTGIWYLRQSTSGFSAVQFGVSTDIPTVNFPMP